MTIAAVLAAAAFLVAQTGAPFENVRIDAFDPDAWNGIVFVANSHGRAVSFALRVGSQQGSFLDGSEIYKSVQEVGPHDPDASYCRMSWHHPPRESSITLEWSRCEPATVVGRLQAQPSTQLVLEEYVPSGGNSEAIFAVNEAARVMTGERYFDRDFSSALKFLVMTDRPIASGGAYPSLEALHNSMSASGRLSPTGEPLPRAAGMAFTPDASGVSHFVAVLGSDQSKLEAVARRWLEAGRIDELLRTRSAGYANSRPRVEGLFAGAAEAIGNTMFWNTLYAPTADAVFPSISRAWAKNFGGWVVGEWDCFFGALLTGVESRAQTLAGLRAILGAQTDTGLVPNLASGTGITPDRSQPPIGSYVIWKTYQKFPDREFLTWAYPRLVRWHEWWRRDRGDGQPWRDGNRDGLLEWGSDRGDTDSVGGRGSIRQAKWESGMDDSPMYDDVHYDPRTYTMNLDDVGLNSLYALDAECLARLAAILGRDEDVGRFSEEYQRLKDIIRVRLWNDRDGIYENRFWDGKYSPRLSPTNFYPMLAGIATPEQARRMVREHLLNEQEFWGVYAIPTIARSDTAFADQFYWRGDIWGPTNYLVYEGLTRYGFESESFEFARKSFRLFMDDWKQHNQSDENYHAWGGNGGGDTHYTWGALLCLIALEQYVDVNPWDGFRFGALDAPEEGRFHGAVWGNHVYDVTVGPHRTALIRDGKICFEANRAVAVRRYEPRTFTIKTAAPAQVTAGELSGDAAELTLDGKLAGHPAVRQGRAVFLVPAGEHTVQLIQQR